MENILLIFYLFIGSGYVKELYSGQMKDFLLSNRYAQHFIGYTSLFLITSEFSDIYDPKYNLFYSALAYIWFIFTTKLDLQWNLAIILLLIFGYIYEKQLLFKQEQSEKDPVLEENDKNNIKQKHAKIRMIILVSIVLITLIGTVFYANKKIEQYGGNFDLEKYLLAGRNIS